MHAAEPAKNVEPKKEKPFTPGDLARKVREVIDSQLAVDGEPAIRETSATSFPATPPHDEVLP